jgi:O-antigen/teichoic acid export membrane protein
MTRWQDWLDQRSSAGTLAIGSVLSQGMLFFATPFLTRLYGPTEYGFFSLFGMTVALLTPLCGMCLSSALAHAADEHERISLAQTGILLAILSSIVLSVVIGSVVILTDVLAQIRSDSLPIWWVLAVSAAVLTIIGQFIYQWNLLDQRFAAAASLTFVSGLVSTTSRIALGFLWPNGVMLAVGQAFGLAAAASTVSRFNPLRTGFILDLSLLKRYREFPLHQTWQQVVNVCSRMMPIPLFTTAFGAASAGHYAVAMLTLGIAGQVIGKAIGDAALSDFVYAHRCGGGLLPVLRRSTRQLVIIGGLPFLLVFLSGPELFAFVFGSEWRDAGEFARWMAPWSFVAFLNSPSLTVINMLREQAWASRLNVMTFALRGAGLFIGVYVLQSAVWGVALFALAGLLHNVSLIVGAFYRAHQHPIRSAA